MTKSELTDYFAGIALQDQLAMYRDKDGGTYDELEESVKLSYDIAELMIKERESRNI